MWTVQSEELTNARGLRFEFTMDSSKASFADVIRAWQDDAGFRSLFNESLADCPYTSFRWETPGVSAATVIRPFECVVLDSPGLASRPEPQAFAQHFSGNRECVVSFANLGRDAILVVPCPLAEPCAYGHLGAFVRLAQVEQRQTLWRTVGDVMAKRICTRPVWLSTAGAGVAWLHVRLDDRPKYYGYGPYRQFFERGADPLRSRD